MVPIIPANDLVIADTQRGAAPVGAVRADRADMLHFPGPRLIPVNAAGQRTYRANVDACATLVAFKVIVMIGNDLRNHATVANSESVDPHPFVADAHAA